MNDITFAAFAGAFLGLCACAGYIAGGLVY